MKRNLNEAFSPTPEIFHDRVITTLDAIKEGRSMKKRYKISALLVAAAVALTLAGGIAIAAANGVFDWAANLYADGAVKQRYETVNKLADADAQTQSTADGKITLELNQSYYNGKELYVGYTLSDNDAAARLIEDYKPDAELVARIKRDGQLIESGMASSTCAKFADAEIKLSQKTFTGTDYGCIMEKHPILSDHSYVAADGAEYDVCYDSCESKYVGNQEIGYREFRAADANPVNAECALPDAPEITLSLKVANLTTYYYKDATGFYALNDSAEPEKLSFEIKRSAAAARSGAGSGQFKNYSIEARVEATDVSTFVTVKLSYASTDGGASDGELKGAAEFKAAGKDAIGGMALKAGDANYAVADTSTSITQADGKTIVNSTYAFPALPQGISEIALTPQWIVAGEKPDETLTITLK